MTGYFITFEGVEGSGKSTQIKKAAAFLASKGYDVVTLREPGGTRVSEVIRQILLNKENTEMSAETELLLYLAARAQIVREKILPALTRGKVVICDRFEDSTLAYQGSGRGFSLKAIQQVSRLLVRGNLQPDLTFVLDMDPSKGMRRGGRHDRMERQSLKFHHKVRRGFLEIVRRNPRRCKILNAAESVNQMAAEIQRKLIQCLKIK